MGTGALMNTNYDTMIKSHGPLAQLAEHLTFNQEVCSQYFRNIYKQTPDGIEWTKLCVVRGCSNDNIKGDESRLVNIGGGSHEDNGAYEELHGGR